MFTIPGRIVYHAGRLLVRVRREAERIDHLISARLKLAGLAQATATSSCASAIDGDR